MASDGIPISTIDDMYSISELSSIPDNYKFIFTKNYMTIETDYSFESNFFSLSIVFSYLIDKENCHALTVDNATVPAADIDEVIFNLYNLSSMSLNDIIDHTNKRNLISKNGFKLL